MFDPIEQNQIGLPKLPENYWEDKNTENNLKNINIFDANINASVDDISIFKNKKI